MSRRVYPQIARKPYRKYDHVWCSHDANCKALREELATHGPLDSGRLLEIAKSTKIPYKTLEYWRCKLRRNALWTPNQGRRGKARKLPCNVEAEVAEKLRNEFIRTQRLCPRQTVAVELSRAWKAAISPEFQAGRTLVSNFLKRQNLTMRKPHVKRRTKVNDSRVTEYLNELQLVKMQMPPRLVINVDETCWRLANGSLRTLAPLGADDVRVLSKCDPKSDVTVIAACCASGHRLPLWVLARGKTDVCEEKFRCHEKLRRFIGRKLFIDHSERGWSTSEVMHRYLSWLKELNGGRMLHVVWDLHSSHRDQELRDWATANDIGLTFVPAGQTDEWQPLDRKLFGSLKTRAQKRLEDMMVDREFVSMDIIDAIVILLESWELITPEEVERAWDALF